jgi:hypothetical protein
VVYKDDSAILYRAHTDESVDRIVFDWFSNFGQQFREENQTDTLPVLDSHPKVGRGFVGYLETTADTIKPMGIMPGPVVYCQYFRFREEPCNAPTVVTRLMKELCGPRAKPRT